MKVHPILPSGTGSWVEVELIYQIGACRWCELADGKMKSARPQKKGRTGGGGETDCEFPSKLTLTIADQPVTL